MLTHKYITLSSYAQQQLQIVLSQALLNLEKINDRNESPVSYYRYLGSRFDRCFSAQRIAEPISIIQDLFEGAIVVMGLVKKLFGGTVAFVGGILGFLSGLLGFGKKSEYFMELEEAKEEKSATATLPASAPQAPPKPAAPAALTPTAKAEPTVQPVKAEAPKPAVPKAEVPAPQPKVPVAKIENGKVETLSETAPAPQPAALVEPTSEPTFAPKYLTQMSTNGRRRPGPSLNYFRDMAKQVKTNAS